MMNAFEEKFHVGKNLTFTFIDSWAKHPINLDDVVQQVNRLLSHISNESLERAFVVTWIQNQRIIPI